MIEILWHGRGGQGAFTAARILGAAHIINKEEHFALAFPSFGPERRGAPVNAFTKLDTKPIGDRSQIRKANFVIYLDDTLFSEAAFDELKEDGKIILNTRRSFDDERIIAVDADAIATQILKLPITNTAMLGVLAALEPQIALDAVKESVKENMPPKLQEKNIQVVEAAYKLLKLPTITMALQS